MKDIPLKRNVGNTDEVIELLVDKLVHAVIDGRFDLIDTYKEQLTAYNNISKVNIYFQNDPQGTEKQFKEAQEFMESSGLIDTLFDEVYKESLK